MTLTGSSSDADVVLEEARSSDHGVCILLGLGTLPCEDLAARQRLVNLG